MSLSNLSEPGYRPSPCDFDAFVPWACNAFEVEVDVVVTRKVIETALTKQPSTHSRIKKKKDIIIPISPSSIKQGSDETPEGFEQFKIISIEAVYDLYSNLNQIRFIRTIPIPWLVIKVIGLAVPYHPQLTTITINQGLYMQSLYELSQLLPKSKITEVYLDGNWLREANYHVLLDQACLKLLSLSKCNITDEVLKTITDKLTYPHPVSTTLCILNLGTNRITDVGAKYIGHILRSNRNLLYLNLSDNFITDEGAKYILTPLEEFALTKEEFGESRYRYLNFLKVKRDHVIQTMQRFSIPPIEPEKEKKMKRKLMKPVGIMKGKSRDTISSSRSMLSLTALFREKAEAIVEKLLGPYVDPFSPSETTYRNGSVVCRGNNSLCYLNLAHNDLTVCSIRMIYEVLVSQRLHNRNPKGLINVVVEGNLLPAHCAELRQIDDLLEMGLSKYHVKPTPTSLSSSKKGTPKSAKSTIN